ncbi:hypothetical protein HJC23_013223 [Cyclotella cryptica]|uniref:Uncharacterized protein n=1 Tax=Cyclotella cryptica TaxID=29204 RepID=A0ABD3NMZ8_9STRA
MSWNINVDTSALKLAVGRILFGVGIISTELLLFLELFQSLSNTVNEEEAVVHTSCVAKEPKGST